MIARENAILPLIPAADYTGKEGYFVKIVSGEASLCTGTTDAPIGVITEGDAAQVSVALIGAGLSGTVKVKITATTPGTIVLGSPLELAAEDGTVKLGTGGGATVVAVALESGAAGELIEALLLTTAGTLVLNTNYQTTCVSTADGAVMSTTGQVTDSGGNALAGRFIVGVYYSEAANSGVPFDFGNPAAQAGTVIVTEHVTDALLMVLTAADGSWGLDNTFTADDVGHVAAWVEGKTTASTVEVDVP
jgi:hypothetical protein